MICKFLIYRYYGVVEDSRHWLFLAIQDLPRQYSQIFYYTFEIRLVGRIFVFFDILFFILFCYDCVKGKKV